MRTLKPVIYKPLCQEKSFKANLENGLCTIESEGKIQIFMVTLEGVNGVLIQEKNEGIESDWGTLVALEYLFGHFTELKNVTLRSIQSSALIAKYFGKNDQINISRSEFFQLSVLWHVRGDYAPSLEVWTETNGRAHPKRAEKQKGLLYSRYIPLIEKNLSFRMIDEASDLEIFHHWHNQPRVSNFWELALSPEELRDYIRKGLLDSHMLPMIAESDGIPVGYFEMYWTREDRLAPYYESEAYDRGFHFLIGNKDFLGFKNTDSILKCLSHFLFLDEVRTRKIMAEPRADNQKVLKYLKTFDAWKKLYEFDFPHKRAALLECRREVFFMGDYL